jgi:cytochrome c
VEEVYAVTAYLLSMAEVVPESFVLSDANIAEVQARMPNRNGMTTEHHLWPGKSMGGKAPDVKSVACMKNCAGEPNVASFLPDFARNAHGNLAEQNRMVGPQVGADTTRPEGAAPAAPRAPAPAPAKAAGAGAPTALLAQRACTACHGMDTKLVGPGFVEIARKYADRADREAYLAEKIVAGGSGVWGSIPMPAQTLPADEVKTIAAWLAAGAPK